MTHKNENQEEEIIPTDDESTDEILPNEDGEEVEEEHDEEEIPEDGEDDTPTDDNEEEDGDEPEDSEEEEGEDDEPEKPETPEVDYRKKFGESTRQNQILSSRFRDLEKVLGDITNQEIPTDEEMKKIVPEWEYLSEREKNDQVKMTILERRQNLILKTITDISKSATFADEVNTFIEANPELAGFETEFNEFILKPSNKGADMELLKDAFLHKKQPKPATPTKKKTPPSLNRGTSSGGTATKKPSAPGEKSPEELKSLRLGNHKAYMEGIRKGTIK